MTYSLYPRLLLAFVLAVAALPVAAQTPPDHAVPVVVYTAPSPPAPSVMAPLRCDTADITRFELSIPDTAFVFDHLGMVLQAPPDDLVQGETASIAVVAPTATAERLRLKRATSPSDGTVAIAGMTPGRLPFSDSLEAVDPRANERLTEAIRSALPATESLTRIQLLGLADTIDRVLRGPCAVVTYRLDNLAAGANTLSIDRLNDGKGEYATMGEITIQAAPTFGGVLTAGLAFSSLDRATYSLVPQSPADTASVNVVSIDEEGASVPRLVLGLSSFLRSRPLGRPEISVAPYLGFDIESPFENLYAGLQVGAADLVYLSIGVHVGRVTRLPDELSDLRAGAVYTGDAIPTVRTTRYAPFGGLSFNAGPALGAFGKLLESVVK